MLKKVNISVYSRIHDLDDYGLPAGDPEMHESTVCGSMKITDGEIRLSYSEQTEGGTVHSHVLAAGEEVTVLRSGAVSSTMIFSAGKKHTSVYEVLPYKFDMTVETLKIRNELFKENQGELEILYNMTVGGASRRAKLLIRISPLGS